MTSRANRRRRWLGGLAAGSAWLVLRPAQATPATMQAAIQRFTGGAPPRPGRVTLELPEIVENGNTVPVTVSVDSPMTPGDHVRRLAVFNEKNPQPDVIEVWLGPRAGRARVSLRMRMAESQTITAVAELSDGSVWQARVDVVVALAACLE